MSDIQSRFRRLLRWQGLSDRTSGLMGGRRSDGGGLSGSSKNVHEKEIGKNLSQVAFDGPDPVARQLVLLGFFNRSGSNLLGDYLRRLPGLTGFNEHLNHQFVLKKCRAAGIDSFPHYMQSLVDGAGQNGLGLKASGSQVEMLHKWNILQMFETVQAVQVIRQDIVSQAVSLWIAKHTKQWISTQSSSMDEDKVPYDFWAIRRIMVGIGEHNTRMLSAFSAIGVPVSTVVYEQLIESPETEVRRVGAFLGIDLKSWNFPEDVGLARQKSEVKSRFVAQARKDLAASW